MKITSLLGAFAVLSLVIVPAFSQPIQKGCACMPEGCRSQEKPADNCAGLSSDNCISQCSVSQSSIFKRCIPLSCTCPGLTASYSGLEYCDPGYSYFSKSGSRSSSPARPNSKDLTGSFSSNAGALSSVFPEAANNVGPPDLDVVEYLPPSAKQVFLVLASDGPLTQKDIIGKTDLPPRTVRYALSRLRGEEMLQERFCFRDARQSLYSLNGI